jgi:regulation of enolase protein 1 (concanavalin A-like superfamily)
MMTPTSVNWQNARWHNRPSVCAVESGRVEMRAVGGTDFWRLTEGLTPRHDGHAIGFDFSGSFQFSLHAVGRPVSQFDQYGLIAIDSEQRWLKAGLEMDGEMWLSAVHTNNESDWSREPYGDAAVTLEVERKGGTVTASVHTADGWRAFRIVTLPGALFVGAYACSPRGEGFSAEFDGASVVHPTVAGQLLSNP